MLALHCSLACLDRALRPTRDKVCCCCRSDCATLGSFCCGVLYASQVEAGVVEVGG